MSPYSRTHSISFIDRLPTDRDRYLSGEVYKPKRWFKFWRRWSFMLFYGQHKFEKRMITADAKKILWINLSAQSLGDSLMDLSGRVLLAGRTVHLLTSDKNARLYINDHIFSKVADDVMDLDPVYDLIIMDAFGHRSFSEKIKRYKNVPYVGMYGFVNGFEVHRTLFCFYRMAELIGVDFNELKPDLSMRLDPYCHVPVVERPYVTIVVGAEWGFRNYDGWDAVISALVRTYRIVLIGSSNGIPYVQSLDERFPVVNYVGKLSLQQTCHVISMASYQICADGGLWHVACALGVPSVCLFADCQLFLNGSRFLRNTDNQRCVTRYAQNCVSDIPADSVITAFKELVGEC
jgi:hypothetical protein